MPSWKLIGAWLLALGVTTTLTWQAVSLADFQVSPAPAEIVAVPEPDADSPTTSTLEGATTSTNVLSGSTSTPVPEVTSTSAPDGTTTSVPEAEWRVHTVTTVGGTVIVRYRSGAVELQAATPLPGFDVEIDDGGPSRVRVEFESQLADIRVDVEPSGDSIQVEIED